LEEDFRRELAADWGGAAYQDYGTAELGIVAYECEVQHGFHLGNRVIVEVLDAATRQPVPERGVGALVVTALRPAYPLLRVAREDVARVLPERCSCGRKTPRLAGVLGRVGAGVKVRGIFIYPHQIEALARVLPGVARITARVDQEEHRDRLTLDVEYQDAGAPPAVEAVVEAARDRLRVRPDAVLLHAPGSLPEGPVLVDARQKDAGGTR